MTEVAPRSIDGRALSRKGAATRRRLIDAAEACFAELGYHDASVVKITEAAGVAQGTFYLYFSSKKDVFDELVRDLNRRVRHAMKEASSRGKTRLEAELLGFAAYFRFTSEHTALYRIIRQAEFVSPEMLRYHYERLSEGYVEALREAVAAGEVGDRPRGDRVGADGDGRAARNALGALERPERAAGRRRPGARADHPRRAGDPAVTRVGLAGTAVYLPERWLTAAEVAAASGIPEQVIVEKFGLRGKHVAAARPARQRPLGRGGNAAARRAGRRPRGDRLRRLLRLVLEGLPRVAGGALDRAPARLRERVRGRVRQRLARNAGGAARSAGRSSPASRSCGSLLLVAACRESYLLDYATSAPASCSTSATAPSPGLLVRDHPRNELLASHAITDGSLSLQVKVPGGGSAEPRRLPLSRRPRSRRR